MEGLKKYYVQLEDDCQKVNSLYILNPKLINNPGVYSLLTTKYHEAEEKGIKVNMSLLLDLSKLNMKIYEFTRILGILLDNAIEASDESEEKVINIAKKLDISDVLDKYPYQMSGGQKQRVASARAIITNPKLILADEPTGALDSKSSRMLLEKLGELNKNLKATILMVTHDAFTASYCSKIYFIKDGKIFNELTRGDDSRKEFFDRIIDVVTLLGGDMNDAL